MSEIKSVIIICEDHIAMLDGEEAKKWEEYSKSLAIFAGTHRMNPFETDPLNWKIFDGQRSI